MSFLYVFSVFVFLLLCALLCLIILVQEGKGGGLGSSFGGDASESVFGSSTPDVLKKITAYFAIAFVASCIILSFLTESLGRHRMNSGIKTELVE